MDYRVDLDIYNGPLDLLLYLIRKEEVEIIDIPVLSITEQYLAYLDLLEALDINVAGEFLVMAATLMEIKSRMILPRPEPELLEGEEEPEEDPRTELIQQLLEYKRFKDAADDLMGLGDEQSRRYGRPAAELVVGPDEDRYALDELMRGVELWDLLNAFARIMRSINIAPSEVVYDDTPIEEVGEQIVALLRERKSMLFSELFRRVFEGYEQVSRTHLVSAFLAVLECIRQRIIAIEQPKDFEDLRVIWRGDEPADAVPTRRAAPPESAITSREAAREAEGFRAHEGHLKGDEFDLDEVQATEFDQELNAIVVPEVTFRKRVYTDDELMGRPEAEDEEATSEDAEATPEAEAPGEGAAPEAPSDAVPPAEDAETAEADESAPPDEPTDPDNP